MGCIHGLLLVNSWSVDSSTCCCKQLLICTHAPYNLHLRSHKRVALEQLAALGQAVAALEAEQARYVAAEDFEAAAALDSQLTAQAERRDALQVGQLACRGLRCAYGMGWLRTHGQLSLNDHAQ